MKYRYVGDHPEVLDGGMPIRPGQVLEVDDDTINKPHAAAMVAVGVLLPLSEPKQPRAKEGRN